MMYGKYFQRVHGKWRPFEKANYKHYPVPGCLPHKKIVGDRKGENLFRNYIKRPQKSHQLYWKTHSTEYKALLDQ